MVIETAKLTLIQQQYLVALIAAGGRERWTGLNEIKRGLDQAGVEPRADSTLYVSLRALARKLNREGSPERIEIRKYRGYRLFSPDEPRT